MDVSLFIASRLRFKGKLAGASIAVSFLVMIIAVTVSSGFRHEISKGISAIAGDVQITPHDMNVLNEKSPIDANASYIPHLKDLDFVESINPVVYRAGIVKEGENIHGVLFKGVEWENDDSVRMRISIPSRLAEITGLGAGDKMTAYFVGEKIKARRFTVDSVHESLVQTDDKLIVLASIEDLQRLNGWEAGQVSALEIMLNASCSDEKSVKEASAHIGAIVNGYSFDSEHPVVASSSVSRYPQLFDWLSLIDFNVLFVLILMTIVAGFNMISGLLIMLFENISTIGLLKALGMKDSSIAKVFLSSASLLILKGMAVGNALALIFCFVQSKMHLLKLDPANYFVSFVPVYPEWGLVLAADLVAFVSILLLLLIPCLFISKVDPANTVRYA